MEVAGNTVLITGATSGIGRALAERFLAAGSKVIAVGRREALLHDLQAHHPGMVAHAADVASAEGRTALFGWVAENHPDCNVLVNNAGMQRWVTDLGEPEDWAATASEIETNLAAPIHLARLFLPMLRAAKGGAVVNVTSGLSFVPKVDVPVYCATKAALHSFTLSMRDLERRRALEGLPAAAVVEIVPPAVNTDLGGPGLHDFGAPLDAFADSVMRDLAAGRDTVFYGFSAKLAEAAGHGSSGFDRAFTSVNALGKEAPPAPAAAAAAAAGAAKS